MGGYLKHFYRRPVKKEPQQDIAAANEVRAHDARLILTRCGSI